MDTTYTERKSKIIYRVVIVIIPINYVYFLIIMCLFVCLYVCRQINKKKYIKTANTEDEANKKSNRIIPCSRLYVVLMCNIFYKTRTCEPQVFFFVFFFQLKSKKKWKKIYLTLAIRLQHW